MPIFDFDILFVYNKLFYKFRDHSILQYHYVSLFTFIGLFINQVYSMGSHISTIMTFNFK
jgi:hypothetical protein